MIENTPETHYLVLPVVPDAFGELPLDEMENFAGGNCWWWPLTG